MFLENWQKHQNEKRAMNDIDEAVVNKSTKAAIIDGIRKTLGPGPLISRKKAAQIVGLSPRFLANLDAQRKIQGKLLVGRRAFYEKEAFLEWVSSRIQVPDA